MRRDLVRRVIIGRNDGNGKSTASCASRRHMKLKREGSCTKRDDANWTGFYSSEKRRSPALRIEQNYPSKSNCPSERKSQCEGRRDPMRISLSRFELLATQEQASRGWTRRKLNNRTVRASSKPRGQASWQTRRDESMAWRRKSRLKVRIWILYDGYHNGRRGMYPL